ncbi:UDP-glucuronosyl/UDP-glucosyltransferase [Dillenia turbinata]|uniref:Glycosyltransferase n=1 Tax=Dillenia turbinata TaxID=194707 RepID=A0AAN8UK98_9MAGN
MRTPHVVVIPYPAQGHVIPMMEISQCLVMKGFKVTFVNTEFNHNRVMKALKEEDKIKGKINLVSMPDGLEPWQDRNELGQLSLAIFSTMPRKLEELIMKINESDRDKVTCVLADGSMGWAIEVAAKMGIKRVAFWPASAAHLACGFCIPKLMEDGIINENGTPVKGEMIQLSPTMPPINPANFVWPCIGDLNTQRIVFEVMVKNNNAAKLVDWLICNTSYDFEPAALSLAPEILPIGPLLASNRLGNPSGYFWPENSTCLKWLDQQPPSSVIYVAFGSFTVFDSIQFQELALGLELSNRPFLWVARNDITNGSNDPYPEGFLDRVANHGQIVGWAPQQSVLLHPSIGCFLSHCGWNSTMEGVSNGVPILCWPYFADQFLNQSYVCDVWKVGLGFNRDKKGVVSKEEIVQKVNQVFGDEEMKARVLKLKEKAMKDVKEGGCSFKNFNNFIEYMKV